jgi:hypothetical protein
MYLLGHLADLERKLKGESSMQGKRISTRVGSATYRQSCAQEVPKGIEVTATLIES